MISADRTPRTAPRWVFPLKLFSFLLSTATLALIVWLLFFSADDDGPDLPKEGGMGQEVTDGHLVYRLTGLRCGLSIAPGAPRDKPRNGQFCELTLEVRNPGDTKEEWNAGLLAGNATYYPDRLLGESSGRGLSDDIAAGGRQSGTLLFDISGNADPISLHIGINMYDAGDATITL